MIRRKKKGLSRYRDRTKARRENYRVRCNVNLMTCKLSHGEQMRLERQAETRSWRVLEGRAWKCGFIGLSL